MEEQIMESPRLLVRPFAEADAPALGRILSDPAVMRFLEPPFSPEQTRAFLREAGLCRPPRVYAVIRKDDGGLIGHLIWHPWEETSMELGWVLARDCWGRGYARELTETALAQTDRDVVIECCPAQAATRHLAESFGFQAEEEQDGLAVYRLSRA